MSIQVITPEHPDNWETMLKNEIDIREIPIEFLSEINLQFEDKTVAIFDIVALLSHSNSRRLEDSIKEFMADHNDSIKTVDFKINLNAVARIVSERVREYLD